MGIGHLATFYFGSLFVMRPILVTIPLPFGPLVAVLSRESIVKLTEEIDELENPII